MRQNTPAFLRLIAAGLFITGLNGVVRGVQLYRVWSSNIPEEAIGSLEGLFQITASFDLLAVALMGLGLLGAARGLLADPTHRRIAGATLGGAAGMCLMRILWSIQGFAADSEGLRAVVAAVPWTVILAAEVSFYLGALLLLWQRARRPDQPALLVGVTALLAAVVGWGFFVMRHLEVLPDGLGGVDSMLWTTVVFNSSELLFGGVFLLLATRQGAPAGAAPTGPAAAGLRVFRSALMARLFVLVGVVSITVFAAATRSVGGMKLALYGGTFLSMATALGMAGGLGRFAVAAPAGGAAGLVATTLLLAGIALDGWTLSVVSSLFSSPFGGRATQTSLQWAQGMAQGVGLLSMLALLTALRQVAGHVDADLLVKRAEGLSGLVIALFVVALGLKAMIASRALPGVLGVIVGGGVLVLAVYALVRLFGLVGAIADQLDDAGAVSPPAG